VLDFTNQEDLRRKTSIHSVAVSFDGATKVMHPGEHQWKHLIGGASFVSLRPVFYTGL